MTLLSLPPEILSIICEYTIFDQFGPERRLHPCTNCRYLNRGARRREHACPPLLLCCRHLHNISSQVFYQHVTVVVGLDYHSQPYYFRCYPTPDHDKDVFSVLLARTSILPHIRNLELLIARSISYNPGTQSTCRDIAFRSNWEDLPTVISSFTAHLPSLHTLSYTVGVGALPNEALCIWPHATKTEQIHRFIPDETVFEDTSTWPVPLSCYFSLSTLLQASHAVGLGGREVNVTRLRLWLTRLRIPGLKQFVRGLSSGDAPGQGGSHPSPDLQSSDDQAHAWRALLRHHTFSKVILQLPRLRVLDVYVPERPSTGADMDGPWEDASIDSAMARTLTRALETAFPHVRTIRLWRAGCENVMSGEYAVF
ncbi:hypothetical protein G647_09227 [Cladophialophora carrionii CBS 160.54]|uniref:F-box domain-containing protein n=1 Tax=Cladophialophora carrionii CBS 160.54 TaxID=1279043 RepID=V9CXR2_9EURO|nr:uncharacterized protein G647_09227 [Cladophialophora carrionii CBS 160.54]ETI19394.1 hypothetical protein G647_09227 [Cladophialophora carrionii CBS 160.54]